MLAWRKTSPERSTPGPLPYQTPNTPSYLPSPRISACWVPQTAVAASSSFRPGWKTMLDGSSHFLAPEQVLVEPADRRAAIARDEARGVEAGEPVALALHQQQADDGLRPGDEDPVLGESYLSSRATSRSGTPASAIGRPPQGINAGSAGWLRPLLSGDMAGLLTYFKRRGPNWDRAAGFERRTLERFPSALTSPSRRRRSPSRPRSRRPPRPRRGRRRGPRPPRLRVAPERHAARAASPRASSGLRALATTSSSIPVSTKPGWTELQRMP